jgi:hypothetical protein
MQFDILENVTVLLELTLDYCAFVSAWSIPCYRLDVCGPDLPEVGIFVCDYLVFCRGRYCLCLFWTF